jgi:hypothetical protein
MFRKKIAFNSCHLKKKNAGRSWFRSKSRDKNVKKLIQLSFLLQAGIDALRTHGAGVSSVREENQKVKKVKFVRDWAQSHAFTWTISTCITEHKRVSSYRRRFFLMYIMLHCILYQFPICEDNFFNLFYWSTILHTRTIKWNHFVGLHEKVCNYSIYSIRTCTLKWSQKKIQHKA